MSITVSAGQIEAALKIGSAFDWKGALAVWRGEDTKAKIIDGLILADDAAKIVGVFIPPVAVVANDVGIAIEVEQAAEPLVMWLVAIPYHQPDGTIQFMGVTVSDKGIFQ